MSYWLVGVDGDDRRHQFYTRQRDAKKAAKALANEINGDVCVWACTTAYGTPSKTKLLAALNGTPWLCFRGMQQKFVANPFTVQRVDAPFETTELQRHWQRNENGQT